MSCRPGEDTFLAPKSGLVSARKDVGSKGGMTAGLQIQKDREPNYSDTAFDYIRVAPLMFIDRGVGVPALCQ